MDHLRVDVFDNGAVRLGTNLVCDGYAEGFDFRVQTHIHDDHMGDFNRSKGLQDIFMSRETKALLIAELNADIEYRDNIISLGWGEEKELEDGTKLTFVRSGHMLGSTQVVVEYPDGLRCGYSGDFSWPINDVIQVDELVVDSTYGSSASIRKYSQGEAESCLLEIVSQRLRHGSVHIHAHRGTIERVLHILSANIGVPILGSKRLISEISVYQANGFALGSVTSTDSEKGRVALNGKSYVRLYAKGDGFRNELIEGTSISCSAFMTKPDNPVVEYSEKAFGVALTNHADFEGTIEYIRATGAKKIVTDNTRSHGVDLAVAVNSLISDAYAQPSSNHPAFTVR
ncbi:MAG: hypothetical protein F4234_11820 [Gammaproteobacteria bacterium]|nr:hypothetical protein [Gammaproteobacteria bacterium]MYF00834.1 hypothetical protein [Gammaproteobacteria bacterium]MYH46129.1 hypothetical protein [Gammaproteobacteria bacterium]MYL14695.1 hypothetical protein [Gammaproteobacteria bacterium]